MAGGDSRGGQPIHTTYGRSAKEKIGPTMLVAEGINYFSPYNPDIAYDRSDPNNVIETHTIIDPHDENGIETIQFRRTVGYVSGDIVSISRWSEV